MAGYDKDRDGTINTLELIEAIRDWLDNRLSTADLINIIQKWLQVDEQGKATFLKNFKKPKL